MKNKQIIRKKEKIDMQNFINRNNIGKGRFKKSRKHKDISSSYLGKDNKLKEP